MSFLAHQDSHENMVNNRYGRFRNKQRGRLGSLQSPNFPHLHQTPDWPLPPAQYVNHYDPYSVTSTSLVYAYPPQIHVQPVFSTYNLFPPGHIFQQQTQFQHHSLNSELRYPMDPRDIDNLVQHLRQDFGPMMNSVRPGFDLNAYFTPEKQQEFGIDLIRLAMHIIAGQNAAEDVQGKDQEIAHARRCNKELKDQVDRIECEVANLKMSLAYYQPPNVSGRSIRVPSAPPNIAQFQTPHYPAMALSPATSGMFTPRMPASAPPTLRVHNPAGSTIRSVDDDLHRYGEAYGYGHAETAGPAFKYDSPWSLRTALSHSLNNQNQSSFTGQSLNSPPFSTRPSIEADNHPAGIPGGQRTSTTTPKITRTTIVNANTGAPANVPGNQNPANSGIAATATTTVAPAPVPWPTTVHNNTPYSIHPLPVRPIHRQPPDPRIWNDPTYSLEYPPPGYDHVSGYGYGGARGSFNGGNVYGRGRGNAQSQGRGGRGYGRGRGRGYGQGQGRGAHGQGGGGGGSGRGSASS